MRFVPKLIKHWYIDLISPLIRFCIRHRLSPNLVTTDRFYSSPRGAALAFAVDEVQWAGSDSAVQRYFRYY